jgi:hypothetical protein
MDITYTIRKNIPSYVNRTSLLSDVDCYEKWDQSNCLCMKFIKTNIPASNRGCFNQHDNVRALVRKS